MKKNYRAIIILFVFAFIVCFSQMNMEGKGNYLLDGLDSPSSANFDTISSIFDDKLDSYNDSAFFPQIYESSLQANYYGLYILDSIGNLDSVDKPQHIQYIMSYYNSSSDLFMDKYAYRYLDTDFSHSYYPLSSVLEVNCYAILSLSLLDALYLINISKTIDFLWSCYNPITSGFIGQPYDSNLEETFKISTMDNTYFAIITLDLLMGSWADYTTQKSELIQYINSLQYSGVIGWKLGGFRNDNSGSFDSLTILFEPNLLSSFYSIKSLEVFGMESTINYPNFYNFLGSLYDSTDHFFRMSQLDFNNNFTNLVATAIGLELSDITGFATMNRSAVLDFLYNNRNSLGMWDGSTTIHTHELIDTFQIIRVLQNTGEISMLTPGDIDQISNNCIDSFSHSNHGFSLISKDYTTINLLYTIIESFNLFDRVSELEIQELYTTISESYYYDDYIGYDGFISYTNIDENYNGFRSYPIEFYCAGNKDFVDETAYLLSHKATYNALKSLKTMFKLDDFDLTHDLARLLENINDTQFLNPSYPDQNGAFLPIMEYNPLRAEFLSKNIFLEYSFYAIKTMELLCDYLGFGGINDINFDESALSSYIHDKLIEDATTLYFQPDHTVLSENLIENTYYAVYVLQQINFFDVDEQKIANFVAANINYSNIKSVYFGYKLSKLLTPSIYLNYDLIYGLIGTIYDDAIKEYYLTVDMKEINQEALLWICDMVVNDLGTSATVVNIDHLDNCVFLSIGNNITFTITSRYSGTYWLWIDGVLADTNTFQSNGDTLSYSLDDYTDILGTYSVKINATALDGNSGEAASSFSVYSDSSTLVNIEHLENCIFLSTGNNVTFNITSQYSGTYWYWVDGILVDSNTFQPNGDIISYSLDDYTDILGNYTVKINATALDDHYGEAMSSFTVYSDSSTAVNIDHLENCIFLSTGNNITFTINAKYSGTYWLWIDGLLMDSSTFQPNGDIISYSLDSYTDTLGNYTIKINATALDGKYGEVISGFSVYSDSSTVINIEYLENCEFLSVNNNITFSITAKYSGNYWYWVDGLLVDSGTFQSNGDIISYSLDIYTDTLGTYAVKINVTAQDGNYGEAMSSFSVYSDSSTVINILSLDNYEYCTTGHDISFSLHSGYPDWYNFSINAIEISSDTYVDGQIFTFSIDSYEVGNHGVVIWARGLDNKEAVVYGNFSVYSTSETVITIHSVDNYIYNSTGNFINFSISTDFPEYYTIEIDGFLVDGDFYLDSVPILHSIDGYKVGLHTITIWANSTDKKEVNATVHFEVFSIYFLEIEIQYLQNYEFKSLENYIIFFINSSYPDSFKFYIDGILNNSGIFQSGGDLFNFSIDGYFIGEHNISIWANSTDGKEALYESSFTVYSLSNTIINIEELPDHEFLTTGNFVKFNISSLYPDYYILFIDGIEVNRSDFESGVYYYVPIDGYSMGFHTLSTWAIGEDMKIGTASGQFHVYSNSTTSINVNQISNYEFMSIGNYINFTISSNYIGTYNVSINGILVDNGNYTIDAIILCSSDGYIVGNHSVLIHAKSLDGKEALYLADFIVFSNSTTVINIYGLEGIEFMSTGNYLNFSIDSDYPDYYELWINGTLVFTNNYTSGTYILYSLDNYTNTLGNHSVYIWAIGKDLREGYVYTEFSVHSNSTTVINIHGLEGFEFMSTGNYLNFSIDSDYPDYYELWINGVLVSTDNYSSGVYILYSLDTYTNTLGNNSIYIWAIGKDLREGYVYGEFNIYSNSTTIINIHGLEGFEFLSTGNFLNFSIDSAYPDYYELWIDGILTSTDNYSSGAYILYSLDNYSNTLGNHSVSIWAIGKDFNEGNIYAEFSIYSNSTTLINIHNLEGFEFLSAGNFLNFSISSSYPDYYELWINDVIVSTDTYSSGEYILYSLDNYTNILGNHSVYIWAIGKDFGIGYVHTEFSVYSASSTLIIINSLEDCEFLSEDNFLNFSIFSSYPDYYELWIDGILVLTDNYMSGGYILYSLDEYTTALGNHTVFIWAIGLDGKGGTLAIEFRILALPNIISIALIKLDNYEYNSTGNEVQFSITSKYPNYFTIFIDNELVFLDNYSQGQLISFSIDNYEIGAHNLTIWAIGLDGKEAEIETIFTVFPNEEVIDPIDELKRSESPLIAIILSSILIILPGIVIGVSHRYQQKIGSILTSKKPRISFKKYFLKFRKS